MHLHGWCCQKNVFIATRSLFLSYFVGVFLYDYCLYGVHLQFLLLSKPKQFWEIFNSVCNWKILVSKLWKESLQTLHEPWMSHTSSHSCCLCLKAENRNESFIYKRKAHWKKNIELTKKKPWGGVGNKDWVEWKRKDCAECSSMTGTWTSEPQSPPDKIRS